MLCTLVFGVLVNSLKVSPFELELESLNSTSIPPDFSEGWSEINYFGIQSPIK